MFRREPPPCLIMHDAGKTERSPGPAAPAACRNGSGRKPEEAKRERGVGDRTVLAILAAMAAAQVLTALLGAPPG